VVQFLNQGCLLLLSISQGPGRVRMISATAFTSSSDVRGKSKTLISRMRRHFGSVPFWAAPLFPKLQGALLDLIVIGRAGRVHDVSCFRVARMYPEPRELLGPGACWLKV
jgi:hypothetical protein